MRDLTARPAGMRLLGYQMKEENKGSKEHPDVCQTQPQSRTQQSWVETQNHLYRKVHSQQEGTYKTRNITFYSLRDQFWNLRTSNTKITQKQITWLYYLKSNFTNVTYKQLLNRNGCLPRLIIREKPLKITMTDHCTELRMVLTYDTKQANTKKRHKLVVGMWMLMKHGRSLPPKTRY